MGARPARQVLGDSIWDGHPVPDACGVEGSQVILELASGRPRICLDSGGGSALMTLSPPGISPEAGMRTTNALSQSSTSIRELNRVRQHVGRLKGGRDATLALDREEGILFASLGGLPFTDPSGNNVMDFRLVLVKGPGEVSG